mgnify:CR=1 FL=1
MGELIIVGVFDAIFLVGDHAAVWLTDLYCMPCSVPGTAYVRFSFSSRMLSVCVVGARLGLPSGRLTNGWRGLLH